MSQHGPRHVSGRRHMDGLTNWRHLQREGFKCQPQRHNATTTQHDAMSNEKAPMKREGVFASEQGEREAGPPPAPTEQSTALRADIRARQSAIFAIASFSASPDVTLQGTSN